jgi:hypothetical protein
MCEYFFSSTARPSGGMHNFIRNQICCKVSSFSSPTSPSPFQKLSLLWFISTMMFGLVLLSIITTLYKGGFLLMDQVSS